MRTQADHPITGVRWVPISKVVANDYNPNSVAKNEMRLLYLSIKNDGFTQPIVAIHDADNDQYVIVDGFHRYTVTRENPDILASTGGCVPLVVIDKPMNDRMASTIRHNRARGKHSVTGVASMVFAMLDGGWGDAAICREIGLDAEELVRLKYTTGFAKLYEGVEYSKAWETKSQIAIRAKRKKEQRESHERAD